MLGKSGGASGKSLRMNSASSLSQPLPPIPSPIAAKYPTEVALARAAFEQAYGKPASVVAFSPGRVNLIGEHTDYNGGFVMPFALQQGIFVAAAWNPAAATGQVRSDLGGLEPVEFPVQSPITHDGPSWTGYVRGVVQGLLEAGVELPGFQLSVSGNLPTGGGLSSSAALEVATAYALLELTKATGHSVGDGLSMQEIALLCQKAEHTYAGTPCGIMDQFAVIFGQEGHILQLDCESELLHPIPMAPGAPQLLVINTMVKHALSDGGYKARRETCEAAAATLGVPSLRHATTADLARLTDPLALRRARHVVSENQRCLDASAALQAGRWDDLGELLYASHASLRDDFSVSCAELDLIVQFAQEIGLSGGVYGARMTGGGFGGCCLALLNPALAEGIASELKTRYEKATGLVPTIFFAEPSAGARMLQGA
jgi:galactokinase